MIAAADLDPDNASILVAGGGGVALSVTRKLKDMGSWVWMVQRGESRRKEIEGMMAIVAKGDVLDKASLAKIFDSEWPWGSSSDGSNAAAGRSGSNGTRWA